MSQSRQLNFNTGAIVNPFEGLQKAMGTNGALATMLAARDLVKEKELERQQRAQEIADQQAFTLKQNQTQNDFTSEQNALQRAHAKILEDARHTNNLTVSGLNQANQAEQNQLDRESRERIARLARRANQDKEEKALQRQEDVMRLRSKLMESQGNTPQYETKETPMYNYKDSVLQYQQNRNDVTKAYNDLTQQPASEEELFKFKEELKAKGKIYNQAMHEKDLLSRRNKRILEERNSALNNLPKPDELQQLKVVRKTPKLDSNGQAVTQPKYLSPTEQVEKLQTILNTSNSKKERIAASTILNELYQTKMKDIQEQKDLSTFTKKEAIKAKIANQNKEVTQADVKWAQGIIDKSNGFFEYNSEDEMQNVELAKQVLQKYKQQLN
jgi:hypothetical protein